MDFGVGPVGSGWWVVGTASLAVLSSCPSVQRAICFIPACVAPGVPKAALQCAHTYTQGRLQFSGTGPACCGFVFPANTLPFFFLQEACPV